MRQNFIRGLALIMGVLLLCPLLAPALAVSAEPALGERFLFASLDGEYHAVNEDGSISLPATDTAYATVGAAPIGTGASTNALYVSLRNPTSATAYLTVHYQCNEGPTDHEVEFVFPPAAEKQTAWQIAEHISSLQADSELELTLRLEGATEANDVVTLYALYDVSVYDPDADTATGAVVAEIEQCYYEPGAIPEEGTIRISGTIPSIFEDDDSTLALFAFGPNDQDSSDVITKTPVARMAISKSFSFTISARNAEEIYARYAVAVVTKEGERRLLCKPIYPDIRTEKVSDTGNFKGFHTDSLYAVLDSGADVEIVDVYLDKLLLPTSDSGNSILYAGDHSYYFFSETEISALDHRIRNLTGDGFEIYLRFLVSPDATGLSYVNQADSSIGIVNKGVDIKSENALLEIHALTDFLTQRYHNTTQGNIHGIILGRAADRSAAYAYVGVQSLSAYAEKYATYLNLVAGSARSNIPGLRIVVPISDRTHADTVTISNLTGDYFSDLFLDSLTAAMEDLILAPPEFSVMLQAAEGNAERAPDALEPLDDFISMIKAAAAKHTFLDGKILYAWSPSAAYTDAELNEAYAIRYVELFFNGSVRSFIVDLSLDSRMQEVTNSLKFLVAGINTVEGRAALEQIGGEYPDLFKGRDLNALVVRQIDRVSMQEDGYADGKLPTGSYPLFDFSQLGSQATWYAGSACGGVAVVDRALTAQFAATTGEEYAEIAYAFGSIKNYSVAPLIRFSLGIKAGEHNASTPYEVQIRLLGGDRALIASTVIRAGEAHELYLNLGGYTDNLAQLESIRVLARPLDGSDTDYELYLNSVYLESATLSSTELAEQISIRTNDTDPEPLPQEDTDYTTPVLITVLVVLVSLVFIAIPVIRYLRIRKRNNA